MPGAGEHPFKVVPIEGKGMGVIATKDVKAGDYVLVEKPFLSMTDADNNVRVDDVKDHVRLVEERINQQLATKTEEERTAFYSLASDMPSRAFSSPLFDILNTDSFEFGTRGGGILLIASRFNHSCRPNLTRDWYEDQGEMRFVASLDIREGDKLTISYIDGCAEPTAERQVVLQTRRRFACTCEVCSLPEEQRLASDSRRRALRGLEDRIGPDLLKNPSQAVKIAKVAVGLLEMEGLVRHANRFCELAWMACLFYGDDENAKKWMAKDVEFLRRFYGPESKRAIEQAALVSRPVSSHVTVWRQRRSSRARRSMTHERAPLLHAPGTRGEGVERRSGRRKASARWIIPASFVFALFEGATVAVDMEVMTQLACFAVGGDNPAAPPPLSLLRTDFQLGSDEAWAARCRASAEVQRSTTETVTTAALLGGILASLTAAWWGSLADRKGRKPVLAVVSLGEILTSVVMILLITFPSTFGYRFYLAGALVSGLLSGALTDFVTGAAYLSDCTSEGSKTQILSLYEATLFLGTGVGPILASSIIRLSGLGIKAPYVGLAVVRVLYLCTFPFMPESLSPDKREEAAKKDVVKKPFLARLLSLPVELLAPLAVLLPKKRDGKRQWQLTLIAVSLALFMILPGLSTVKMLYARSRFDWGPEEIGRWTSFSSLCKLFVLVGALPLANRFFRRTPRTASTEEETAKRKKKADSAFDLTIARRSILCAFLGYVVMSIPASSNPRNFLTGTLLTSFAAATPPALQSLALTFCAPEDAGKVLASITALATISTATVGPFLFGAVYIWAVEWWPELIFVMAAIWISCAFFPLLLVRLPRWMEPAEEEV